MSDHLGSVSWGQARHPSSAGSSDGSPRAGAAGPRGGWGGLRSWPRLGILHHWAPRGLLSSGHRVLTVNGHDFNNVLAGVSGWHNWLSIRFLILAQSREIEPCMAQHKACLRFSLSLCPSPALSNNNNNVFVTQKTHTDRFPEDKNERTERGPVKKNPVFLDWRR